MATVNLMGLGYYDPQTQSRLTVYADTLVFDTVQGEKQLVAVRFGGYPEMVQAMSDAIYAGGTVEADLQGRTQLFHCATRNYRRQLAHDGVYATSTMMITDDPQTANTDASSTAQMLSFLPRKRPRPVV